MTAALGLVRSGAGLLILPSYAAQIAEQWGMHKLHFSDASKHNAEDSGCAIADVFRVENGKIVEHGNVIQTMPEQSANANTMF